MVGEMESRHVLVSPFFRVEIGERESAWAQEEYTTDFDQTDACHA